MSNGMEGKRMKPVLTEREAEEAARVKRVLDAHPIPKDWSPEDTKPEARVEITPAMRFDATIKALNEGDIH